MASNIFSSHTPRLTARGPVQYFAVSSTAAGTYYFNLSGLLRPGVTNIGLAVQAIGAQVTASLSLQEPSQPTEPTDADLAALAWFATTPVAAGGCQLLNPPFANWIKLVFAGAGTAYVGSM